MEGSTAPITETGNATLMRLSAAAAAADVSPATLEYYILLGLVRPLRQGQRRLFDQKMVRRVRLIRRLNRTGYTLRDIAQTYLARR
ncbi:MAG: MerR family transcriptional regulator [Planctomycetaceae bacterium]|nr:MerR family transcriptional regulator [Planctomycetaceae bacterium]